MVRIRIRGTIIRIQITETRIRTIIRIRRQKGTSRHDPIIFQYFNLTLFSLLREPNFAVRQNRHKRNPRYANAYEERKIGIRQPKPATAPLYAKADKRAPYHPGVLQPESSTQV